VPSIVLESAGGVISTVSLRQTVLYTAAGDSVRPTSAAGSTNRRAWVAPNELAGGYFEYSNGDVRKITRNTAGALTDTGTPAELRCTIYVEGSDGGEGASGTGYIWPPRALILIYLRGAHPSIQPYLDLTVTSATTVGPEGYRQIGVAAIGRVQVLGYGVDRTEARALESGFDMQELADRSRVYSERGPDRRRAEVAIVDTLVDVQQVRGTAVSPDYVLISAAGGAYPAADRHADPLVLEGLARECRGHPVVWLPQIPTDPTTGSGVFAHVRAWGLDALYSYMTAGRREQVPVGRTGTNDAYRYSTLVFDECV